MEFTENKKLVKIRLFEIVRENTNHNYLMLLIDNDVIQIRELEKEINKLYHSLHLDKNVVFTSNKIICDKNAIVNHNDEISILPHISGG